MTTRNRSKGSRTNPTTVTSSTEITGGVFATWEGFNRPPGTNFWPSGHVGGSDTRESMTDTVDGTLAFHACSHDKWDIKPIVPPSSTWKMRDSAPGHGRAVVQVNGSYAMQYALDSPLAHNEPASGPAIAKSRCSVWGSPVLSGLNSLYELKDFAPLLRNISKGLVYALASADVGKVANKTMDRLLAEMARNGVRGFLLAAVNADLEWKFNWKSFLGDIQKVHSLAGRLGHIMNRLASQRMKAYGVYKAELENGRTHYTNVGGGSYDFTLRSCVSHGTTRSEYRYGVEMSYPNLYKRWLIWTELEMVRRKLGLYLTASTVWKALPRSFIVDWFLPVSDWLEQFNTSPIDQDGYVVHRRWLTKKLETNWTVTETIKPRVPSTIVLEDARDIVVSVPCRRVTYSRSVPSEIDLVSLDLPKLHIPAGEMWWTGFELLVSRALRR